MAHKFSRSLFALGDTSKTIAARPSDRSAFRCVAVVMLALVSAVLLSLPAQAQTSPYVPAVVTSSVSSVPTTAYDITKIVGSQVSVTGPQDVSVDSCGNIYTLDFGLNSTTGTTVTEIPAGGGGATVVFNEGSWYDSHMGQDQSHAYVLVGNDWSTNVRAIPLINCVPQISQSKFPGGTANTGGLCWYNVGYVAGDFLGNYVMSTNSTACVTGSYWLINDVATATSLLLPNAAKIMITPVVDKLQNVYFITDATVYELQYSGGAAGKYAAVPVVFGNYINPVGLSMDFTGNLFVADSSAAAIYEIPNEAAVLDSKGNVITPAGLNLADRFTVAGGLIIDVAAAVNSRGDMYYTAPGATSVSELTLGNANFLAVPTGQSATRVLNFQFNAAATLTAIQAPGGDFTIKPAGLGTTACAVSSTAYLPTAITFTGMTAMASTSVTAVSATTGLAVGQVVTGAGISAGTTIADVGNGTITLSVAATASSKTAATLTAGNTNCQITVAFQPKTVGKQSSAVAVTYTTAGPLDKNSKSTTITVTANVFVEGMGQGALLTLDPGTVTPAGSGFRSPAGAVVDQAGNTFVADIGNNAVMEFPAGGGAAVSVAIASAGTGVTDTPLSAPAGVAVDGAGNVFIADTGNNRVVEVPFLNGSLSPAASTVVASGLKGPASVFVHTNGDLYVADTGDNTILVYPSFAGTSNAGAVFGSPTKLGVGLLNPLAVTVDGPGNVYIADSGNNQILEYPLGAGQEIVAANILNPSGLATDSSGSLFVVDQGNYRVLRIPSVNGTLAPNDAAEVGLGVANPYGVAIDASSNLYVTDRTNAAAYTVARTQIGLGFGDLAVGTASVALPLTVESAGNLPLVFSEPYFMETGNAGDFAMTSPTGACADGLTLPTGTSCDLATTFTPTVAGSRSAIIAFEGNAANAPQVTLSGTGASPSPTTATLVLTPSQPGAPFYGEPLSVAATVAPTTGTGAPTGFVSFVLDGTQVALLPVTKGVATLQLNSGLTGGAHTIYAVYKGDTSNNASSSVVLPIQIAKAPTTAALVVTTVAYNNPYSLRHSNTGSCNVTDTAGNVNQYPIIYSDSVGFTATINSPGVGVPSGTLTFYSDGVLINGVADPKTGFDPKTGKTWINTSITPVLPYAGGLFLGNMSSTADTLGDGTTLGENDVLVTPHVITAFYSGDQNYLPSTSVATTVTVTDVSPTTPVTLPQVPVSPAPYCDANSTIVGSRPSDPSTFAVAASNTTITASANTPGTTTLTISSLGGWTGGVDVTCPDLPQYATCSTNPGQATISPSTPGATLLPSQMVLTVATNVSPYVPTAARSGFFWLTSVLLGLLIIASRRRFRQATGGLTIAVFALLLFVGIAGLSGCGSSTSSSVVTKPGSYQISVMFTSAQSNHTNYNFVSRADLPYKMSFTLNVK